MAVAARRLQRLDFDLCPQVGLARGEGVEAKSMSAKERRLGGATEPCLVVGMTRQRMEVT